MKTIKNAKLAKRFRIKKRVRSQVQGTQERPRLTVFRSNKSISAQLIDDVHGTTLASASDIKIEKGTKSERAKEVGKAIAQKAVEKNITEVVFDRNGYKYMGRVQTLADSAREAGLKF